MQALAGLLGIAAFFGMWVLVARRGRGRGWSGFKRHTLGALMGVICMIVVTGILSPPQASQLAASDAPNVVAAPQPTTDSQPPPEDQVESDEAGRLDKIKKMSRGITEVSEPAPDRLIITQKEESVWSEKAWVNSTTIWTAEFLEELAKAYPSHYREVVIRFVVPVKDRYGNSGSGEAMTLTYDMSEIAKVNWDGVTLFDIMNFAEVYFRPIGRQGALEWCADGNAKYTLDFCTQALN